MSRVFRSRRRKGVVFGLTSRIIASIGVAAGIVGYAFMLGGGTVRQERDLAQTALAEQRSRNTELVGRLEAALATMETKIDRIRVLEETVSSLTPTETELRLTKLMRRQIAAGADPKALSSVLEFASLKHNCSDPITRHLFVSTNNRTDTSWVQFNNAVTVRVRQESSNQGTFFDPNIPVSVTFTVIGGTEKTVTDILPAHHSLIAAGRLFLVTVFPAEKGRAEVSVSRCEPVVGRR